MTIRYFRQSGTIAAVSFAIIIAFYVLREHWSHALGALPYPLLLACPLLHLLHGHGGHGQHDHAQHPTGSPTAAETKSAPWSG